MENETSVKCLTDFLPFFLRQCSCSEPLSETFTSIAREIFWPEASREGSRPVKPDPKGAKRARRRTCGSRSRVFEAYGWRQQRCEPIRASRAKRPAGFSLDAARRFRHIRGRDGRAGKCRFIFHLHESDFPRHRQGYSSVFDQVPAGQQAGGG